MNREKIREWAQKWTERFGAINLESNGSTHPRLSPIQILEALSCLDTAQKEFFRDYLDSELGKRSSDKKWSL